MDGRNTEAVHTLLKIALVNGVPVDTHPQSNASSAVRGVDVHQLGDYLWWRLANVWQISEQVGRALGLPEDFDVSADSAHASSAQTQLVARHIATARKSLLRDGEIDVAAGMSRLLKLWREGTLYRQMGIYPATARNKYTQDRQLEQ